MFPDISSYTVATEFQLLLCSYSCSIPHVARIQHSNCTWRSHTSSEPQQTDSTSSTTAPLISMKHVRLSDEVDVEGCWMMLKDVEGFWCRWLRILRDATNPEYFDRFRMSHCQCTVEMMRPILRRNSSKLNGFVQMLGIQESTANNN